MLRIVHFLFELLPQFTLMKVGILSHPSLSAMSLPTSRLARACQTHGGEGGIRTHERFITSTGFQDQLDRPLRHLTLLEDLTNLL